MEKPLCHRERENVADNNAATEAEVRYAYSCCTYDSYNLYDSYDSYDSYEPYGFEYSFCFCNIDAVSYLRYNGDDGKVYIHLLWKKFQF